MARSASMVDVWNLALIYIGETTFIDDPNDSRSLAANICRRVWHNTVERVIADFPWPWCVKQAAIAEASEDVTRTGWEHVYVIPNDCVTPLWLLVEDERISLTDPTARIKWTTMADDDGGGLVLCADVDIDTEDFEVLEYVAYHEEVQAWSRAFTEAVAWALSKPLALALRKEEEIAIRLCEAEFEKALSKARMYELNKGVKDDELDTPSLALR